MNKKTSIITIILGLLVIICFIINDKFVFYHFGEDSYMRNIELNEVNSNEGENQFLYFTYDNNNIILNKNVLLQEDIKSYGIDENEEVEKLSILEKEKNLNEKFTGSFISLLPEIKLDIDDDSEQENVFISAKTDTLDTQGFSVVRTNFSQKDIPLEIVLSNKKDITVYVKGELLKNSKVIITSPRGLNNLTETDEDGMIYNLKLKDIRSGITISYEDNLNNYYISSYIVESSKLFTANYFDAIKPVLICVVFATLLILLIIIKRKILSSLRTKGYIRG